MNRDVFDYITKKLRDIFSYFKSRTKNKYEGDRFEEGLFRTLTFRRIQKKLIVNPTGDF